MPLFNRTPEKYEAKALEYERKGKSPKAIKYRQKASQLRAKNGNNLAAFPGQQLPLNTGLTQTTYTTQTLPTTGLRTSGSPVGLGQWNASGSPAGLGQQQWGSTTTTTQQFSGSPAGLGWQSWQSNRTPAIYEQNALKWEQRGNWTKAQKNREKYWRLQNPQYAKYAAPTFYQNNQFLGYNQPYGAPFQNLQGSGSFSTNTTFAAPIVEQFVRPTIVEQTTRAEKITHIQPIVHREIEAPTVRVIEKHVYETVPSSGPTTLTNAPIIQETVRPKIIEEIQPVVHREVPAPFVERVEQHVTEHIVNPTITTKQVLNTGTTHQAWSAAGGPVPLQQQGFAAGGPAPLQQTTTNQGGLMGKVKGMLHHNNQGQTTQQL